jgi:hypothetical protein
MIAYMTFVKTFKLVGEDSLLNKIWSVEHGLIRRRR